MVRYAGSWLAWQGLREVQRVLRPGGKAYIGGGAGSGYPAADATKLVEERTKKLEGEEAEKWQRFVELRRPEQMRKWAEEAGLPNFRVFGRARSRRTIPTWAKACGS